MPLKSYKICSKIFEHGNEPPPLLNDVQKNCGFGFGWHPLDKVTTFFKPSFSGDSLNPTDVHTLSFYEGLIDKLDREQEKADGDAQKPILRVRCECIECQFGFPSFQCKYQRCHLCK